MKGILREENIRTEYDASLMNININKVEEMNKESYYEDNVYVPKANPQSVNAVEKIKEGVPYKKVDDDFVTNEALAKKLSTDK